jgi:hypothetical protein
LLSLPGLDFAMPEEPDPHAPMRQLLTSWLDYQRAHFRRKLRDLSPEGVAAWSVPPLDLSILGLVRHMTQMEHFYLAWGLGGGERLELYGDDDYAGGNVATIDDDWRAYQDQVAAADAAIAVLPGLDAVGKGHGRPLGATLVKMIDEYALHSGEAHMLRYAALGRMLR